MPKLLDFLSFKDIRPAHQVPVRREDTLRKDERDAAVLAGKYPNDDVDIERASEYRLASLMQYPHY